MAKTKRKGLVFLLDQMQLAEEILSSEELGQMYAAIRRYVVEDELPDTSDKSTVWCATFNMLCRAQEKAELLYQETCERNRAAAYTRWHTSV